MKVKLFTSESVCSGHPDKIADAISDAILDEILSKDPYARTGIETVVGANHINIFGEVTTSANINYELIVRNKIKSLGYTEPKWGFSDKSIFTNYIHQQSKDISIGVDNDGAGDQGMMFGYACRETKELMPLPISIAHAITKRIDQCRENNIISWLRPDGKSQVTIKYIDYRPVSVDRIVVAIAHNEEVNYKTIRNDIISLVLKYVLDIYGYQLPLDNHIVINGTGKWTIPGPYTDAGLTGRKIVVDGYGGYARVGGGAFSGKDPSKVDRSGAYAARYIAKNIVANNFADKCEIGLAYAIGKKEPLMVSIDTFDTNNKSEILINHFTKKLIDLNVKSIIEGLNLRRPIYSETSSYGHFGNDNFPWEKIINSI